ncbi:MAG TPA: DUF4867 family protein [Candidatus Monoglobus merdigallinarum]|uniref:DUF4867 family protein n=1 Tax=Candidatus Monoglobus merdigallinarum TaxID=2838698 RepID=A0A9D1PPR1_9FIRM|nr:DUF4867 family protein [Candidatus Monoglobus merdigallinarum]
MSLTIKPITDEAFAKYGRVVEGIDWSGLLETLRASSPAPDSVIYVPSCPELEALPVKQLLSDNVYGGMPVQIGYCNGTNTKLNCLEYHRDSEIDIADDDVVLLLGSQQDAAKGEYDTAKIEAFLCPKGTGVELYATTLHYAPCSAKLGQPFRVVIVLPKGTNEDKPDIEITCSEDERLFARNKWLIAHPEAPEAAQGAVVALTGENIDIKDLI